MNSSGQEKEIRSRLRSGASVRRVATDLGLPRSEVQLHLAHLKSMRRKRVWSLAGTAALALLASALLMHRALSPREPGAPTEEAWRSNFGSIGVAYLASRPSDKWLIESDYISPSPAQTDTLRGVAARIAQQINTGLKRNAVIPAVDTLRQLFAEHLAVTFFSGMGGGTSIQVVGAREQQVVLSDPYSQEITIYGHFAEDHPLIKGHMLSYNHEWNSLMIGGIEWNPIWLEALSIHELYHAKMAHEGAKSATASALLDEFIEEEVVAHDLEREVLNIQTGGKYDAVVQEILDMKTARTSKEFLEQLTMEDLLRLDGLFTPGGTRESGVRFMQFCLSLLNSWTGQDVGGNKQLVAQKIANYRLLTLATRE